MIDTIIFDAEGVVIDTETLWDRSQEEFLQRRGFVYDREIVKPLLTGRSVVDGVRVMQKIYGFAGDVEKLAKERLEIVKNLFNNGLSFVDGFEDFFNRVRVKYKTCIATAMDDELLLLTDQRLGLSDLFSGNIFPIAEVGYAAKPQPDIFLHAARRLGSPVAQCLVIEDAPLGVEAAKQAGMQCVALTTTYRRTQLTQADFIVDGYADVDMSWF